MVKVEDVMKRGGLWEMKACGQTVDGVAVGGSGVRVVRVDG